MNTKAFGATAQQVVDSITPSVKKWISNIKPIEGEISSNLRRLNSEGKALKFAKSENIPKTAIDQIVNDFKFEGFSDDVLNTIEKELSGTNVKNLDDTINNLKNTFDNTNDLFDDAKNIILNDLKTEEIKPLNLVEQVINTPRAYFDVADTEKRNTRIATAVGGYAAANIGMRYISGGTITQDQYGQRDIAGIPFV